MSYEYVKKHYLVNPVVGQRVQHEVTKKFGKIARQNVSALHYIMVKFDGSKHSMPCHPLELGLPKHSPQVRSQAVAETPNVPHVLQPNGDAE